MGQSPSWEIDSRSASQEITRLLRNPCSQEPSTGPYSEQDHPVHTLSHDFFKINFNIISHLRKGLPSGFFPLGISAKLVAKVLQGL
jgi:hypothetical protein